MKKSMSRVRDESASVVSGFPEASLAYPVTSEAGMAESRSVLRWRRTAERAMASALAASALAASALAASSAAFSAAFSLAPHTPILQFELFESSQHAPTANHQTNGKTRPLAAAPPCAPSSPSSSWLASNPQRPRASPARSPRRSPDPTYPLWLRRARLKATTSVRAGSSVGVSVSDARELPSTLRGLRARLKVVGSARAVGD